MRIIELLILLPMLLSACSQKQVKFVPIVADEAGQSVVYIYRQNSLSNIIISPDLLVDGKTEAIIKNNSYINFLLKPGQHNIKLDLSDRYEGENEADFMIDGEKVYFFKVTTKMKFKLNQPYDRSFDIHQVDSSLALKELQNIRTIEKHPKTKRVVSKDNMTIFDEEKTTFSIQKTRSPFSK